MSEDFREIRTGELQDNPEKYIQYLLKHGLSPSKHHIERHGGWVHEVEPSVDGTYITCQIGDEDMVIRPRCSFREKRAIIDRLLSAWVNHPEMTLGQLVSIQFSSLIAIFRVSDDDFIEAIESVESFDQSEGVACMEKELLVARGLKETLARMSDAVDSIEGILADLGGDECSQIHE